MNKQIQYSNIVMTPAEDSAVRYSLIKDGLKPLIVIGFNPSTANAKISDRTMDSVLRLASYNGYDGFAMLNLYPLRASSPKALPISMDETLHQNNIVFLRKVLDKFPDADILLAYGNLVNIRPYTRIIAEEIRSILKNYNRNILCIRKLKSGNPKHPLYTKSETKFQIF